MLVVVLFVVEQFFNGGFESGKPPLFLCVGKVDSLVSSRSSNVEFRFEDIDARNHSAKSRHGECCMAFILSRSILADDRKQNFS